MSDENKDESSLSKVYQSLKSFWTSLTRVDENEKPLPASLTPEKLDAEIRQIMAKEDGWIRVKRLFEYDETLGRRSDFFLVNEKLISSVFIVGFVIGSVIRNAETREHMAKNTQLTVYTNKAERARAAIDFMYLQTVKGGLSFGGRYALFSGLILGSSMVIQAYRNKSSVVDYTAGGMISGGLLRMHHGLANLAVGSVVGGLFGTLFGTLRYFQLQHEGYSYEQVHYEELKQKIILRERFLETKRD